MRDGKASISYSRLGLWFELTDCGCSFGHETDSITSHELHSYVTLYAVQRVKRQSFPLSAAILGDVLFKLLLNDHLL